VHLCVCVLFISSSSAGADKPSASAINMAKKDKLKDERERKRAAYLARKEEQRKKRGEERKQHALKLFLKSNREIRNRVRGAACGMHTRWLILMSLRCLCERQDVAISNWNMSTNDGSMELLKVRARAWHLLALIPWVGI